MPEKEPKRYWMSMEEPEADVQFSPGAEDADPVAPNDPRMRPTRRDFLKAAGFTFAGAALTGCSRAPVEKAFPYLIQPEGITPGRSYFYASTCAACSAGCGILVKNRDGRPIKLEGNPDHPISGGGLCAVGQASLLGLYDSRRILQPLQNGAPVTWGTADRTITSELETLRRDRHGVRFLSGTVISPTTQALIRKFLSTFPDARHVVYDPLSHSAILDAHEMTHGIRLLPRMKFDQAEVIVSFDADFLGTWISPVEFARGYRAGRKLVGNAPKMSYHAQFESRLSLTGARADKRVCLAPQEIASVLNQLASRLAKKAGVQLSDAPPGTPPVSEALLDSLANRLWEAKGRSLVVCGIQDVPAQVLCNFINYALGNYGSTLDLENPSLRAQGSDRDLTELVGELHEGRVAALFILGVNPVYELPQSEALVESLRRVPLVVSLASRLDETASVARFVCPESHFLESWNDAEAVSGTLSLFQPAIHPFGITRSATESLAAWSGAPQSARDLVRARWQSEVFPRQANEKNFEAFWDRALSDGYVELAPEHARPKPFKMSAVRLVQGVELPGDELALVLYSKVAMHDGRHAYNPWLQELPDPISKVTWDNYACLSPSTAERLGIRDGDVVHLEARTVGSSPLNLELPALIQPGQHERVVAVALGYGSKLSERFSSVGPVWLDALSSVGEGGRVGKNAAPFLDLSDGSLSPTRRTVRLTKTGNRHELACTQTHNTLNAPEQLRKFAGERTTIVRETTLAAFLANPSAGNESREQEKKDLWPADHPYKNHRWGMVIDLNACTGCSACVLACQVENNVPVVGKDEVRRAREMHWIRLDRYYAEAADGVDVLHQPMLCQQCENAPCETVCPVLATVHNDEGLNVQVYNRCVGTRYCANNCPYKVRRFNWFDYPHDDRLQNLVLNPDVTVRSRGVMEKCSFCLQRIQEAKIEAKRTGAKVSDGQVETACQQSCPTRAIAFGDLNDPESEVSRLSSSGRLYHVLEELNVRPVVGYLTLVRNRPASEKV